jgi:hypothetical protein
MDSTIKETIDGTEIGLVVFDDVDTPLVGWQVGNEVERVESPTNGRLLLGNQQHRIANGRSTSILPASFLPVTIDEIGTEWGCRPMQAETLLSVARLVRRVFAVALKFAKTIDASASMDSIVEADSLAAFFTPLLQELPMIGTGDEAFLTIEGGDVPEHYVSVAARRPRLAHLADALAVGRTTANDPVAEALLGFVQDPHNAASWSAGVVAEALLRALPDHAGLERVLGEDATLAFADLGYPVTYELGGLIKARIQPAAREAFVRTMIENGYVPDDDTLDDGDLRELAEGFRWGGGETSRVAVWAHLSRRQDLLWNLDKAALAR